MILISYMLEGEEKADRGKTNREERERQRVREIEGGGRDRER